MPPGRVTRTISSAIRHGSRHVLEHVGGVADVDRAVARTAAACRCRAPCPVAISPSPDSSPTSASSAKYVAPAPRTRRGSSPGPPPTSSTVRAVQVGVLRELADRVRGERAVEAVRVGLLDRNAPQQPHRPPQDRPATAGQAASTGYARADRQSVAASRQTTVRYSQVACRADGRSRSTSPARTSSSSTGATPSNPEGGGSERYVEKMARGLVERGRAGHHPLRRPRRRARRRDRRRRPVRPARHQAQRLRAQGCSALRRGALGPVDLVVDVQNGLPFFTRLATRSPVVVLVHHVHREQWPVVYPGLVRPDRLVDRAPARAAALPPLPVRRGVAGDPPRARRARRRARPRSPSSTTAPTRARRRTRRAAAAPAHRASSAGWCRTSRSSTRSTPSLALRAEHPDAAPRRRRAAAGGRTSCARTPRARGVGDRSCSRPRRRASDKHESTRRSWVMALPSLKEGWGLVDRRGRQHGTPTVAYRIGRRHPRVDRGRASGLLVDDPDEFVAEPAQRCSRTPDRASALGQARGT